MVSWIPCLILCEQSRFLFVTMILSKPTSSDVMITYMLLYLDASFAVHSACSILSPVASLLRCQGECVSICKPNSNLFVAGGIHRGHKRFSDNSRGTQCSFMSFSAFLRAQSLPIAQWTVSTADPRFLQKEMNSNWMLYG